MDNYYESFACEIQSDEIASLYYENFEIEYKD